MTRPILAALVKPDDQPIKSCYQGWLSQVRFPLLCTPKIDGIRCRLVGSKALSRSNKPIANLYVRARVEALAGPFSGVDGELVTYTDGVMDSFHDVQSKIMSEQGEVDFKFLAFDFCDVGTEFVPYDMRISTLQALITQVPVADTFQVLPVTRVENLDALLAYQDNCIQAGFEGWCGRRPNAIYKEGRSTFNQHYLLKGKLFEDADAEIIGFKELQHNENPAELNQLGYLARPSNKENLRPGRMLGAWRVRDLKTAQEFWLGGGFTQKQRQDFWERREPLLGKICTYRHQPYGAKDRPRILTFVGLRYDL